MYTVSRDHRLTQLQQCKQNTETVIQSVGLSGHWRTKLVKCLKNKYDVLKKSVDRHSQFSCFVGFPVSAANTASTAIN